MLSRSLLLLICLCLALSLSSAADPVTEPGNRQRPRPRRRTLREEELDVEEALEEIRVLLEEKEYKDTTELASRILEADTESWEAYYYRGFAYAHGSKTMTHQLPISTRRWKSVPGIAGFTVYVAMCI